MPGFGANTRQGRDRRAGRLYRDAAAADTGLGQRGDCREPRHPCHGAGARPAALRGRSAEPVRRGRDRRPPRHHPRRRPLRAAGAVSDPLRAAWRTEIHARRPLRLLHVARRLGQQIRSLDPDHAVGGARRHQFAQYRDFARRQAYRGRELSAAHPRDAVDRRSVGREDLRGQGQEGKFLAGVGGVPGAAARQLHRGAEGRAGNLGDRDRPECAAGLSGPGAFAREGHDRGVAVVAGAVRAAADRGTGAARRFLLRSALPQPDRLAPGRARRSSSISPSAATSSSWPCPACRISAPEFPGPGTGGR